MFVNTPPRDSWGVFKTMFLEKLSFLKALVSASPDILDYHHLKTKTDQFVKKILSQDNNICISMRCQSNGKRIVAI